MKTSCNNEHCDQPEDRSADVLHFVVAPRFSGTTEQLDDAKHGTGHQERELLRRSAGRDEIRHHFGGSFGEAGWRRAHRQACLTHVEPEMVHHHLGG